METLYRILLVADAIVCVLLVCLILMQRSKGQGVGLSFGGGAEAVFGSQVGNILTRATVILGILFLVITTCVTMLRPVGRSNSVVDRVAPPSSATASEAPKASSASDVENLDFLDEPVMNDNENNASGGAVEAPEATVQEAAAVETPVAATEAQQAEAIAEAVVEEVPAE